jgi:hypothetical protein
MGMSEIEDDARDLVAEPLAEAKAVLTAGMGDVIALAQALAALVEAVEQAFAAPVAPDDPGVTPREDA